MMVPRLTMVSLSAAVPVLFSSRIAKPLRPKMVPPTLLVMVVAATPLRYTTESLLTMMP
jgi:hypothetical protein